MDIQEYTIVLQKLSSGQFPIFLKIYIEDPREIMYSSVRKAGWDQIKKVDVKLMKRYANWVRIRNIQEDVDS